MTVVDEIYWDPFDIDLDTDPYDTWRRMRDDAPVYRNERYGFVALSRHADVQAASQDVRTFISGRGTVLELMGPELSRTGSMIFMDPPEHDQLRHLVSRAFTPRRVSALEEFIRDVCRDCLDPQLGAASFDYLVDFGAQLPSRVISHLLGIPPSEQQWALERIDAVFHIEPGVGMVNDVSLQAGIDLFHFLADQLDERRRAPRDDLLTGLVQAEIPDDANGGTRRLTNKEGADFANLIIQAGTETVARLLGWAAVVLAEHPDQRTELVGDASLIPNAIEELLRYEAPSTVQGRWTIAPVALHGTKIPVDSKVLLLTASAGRDERKYPDPDRFDIHRHFDTHLSFGFGIHFCLGAALARLEGRVALEETLARFPKWEVDHDNAVRLHTSTVRGYKSVPVVI